MKAQKAEEESEWKRFEEERRTRWAEEEAERAKRWKREAEDHEYNVKQQQKKVSDEFAAQVEAAKRAEQYRVESLNRSWAEREAALKNQEAEVANLRKQVAEFDARIKSEVQKAEVVLGNTLKKHYEHEKALLLKDCEAQKSIADMRVGSLEGQVSALQAQIKDLHNQLAVARADAKEVANQALQSASGRQVAEALQRVVDTREPTPGKSK